MTRWTVDGVCYCKIVSMYYCRLTEVASFRLIVPRTSTIDRTNTGETPHVSIGYEAW